MSFKSLFGKRNPGAPLILPMKAFYARDKAFEARRARFYGHMAKEFESEGWKTATISPLKTRKAGRAGRRQDVVKGTYKSPADKDLRASASEFLQQGTILNDPAKILASDRDKALALGYGDIRRTAARIYVDMHEVIAGSLMASPDLLKEGHGSAGSTTPAEGRLWCAQTLNEIRATMPDECAALIDRVLLRDEMPWEAFERRPPEGLSPAARKAFSDEMLDKRNEALEDLRMALDFVAFGLNTVSLDRLTRRWLLARRLFILKPAMDRARREV